MAIPFYKYLAVKDNYCIIYSGKDKEILKRIIKAKEVIEKELKGIKLFIVCNDIFEEFNVIVESKSSILAGKMAYTRVVEDDKFILEENFVV